jgi:hypothetical protein
MLARTVTRSKAAKGIETLESRSRASAISSCHEIKGREGN